MSSAEYSVENAKSNRSTCKVCKVKIDMGALRVGTSTPGPGDYMMTSWRHLECQKKPKALDDLAKLAGLGGLSAADREKVEAWFSAVAASPVKAKKRKAGDADGDGGSELPVLGDLKKMKAGELKVALSAYGLPKDGTKAQHIQRLDEVKKRQETEARYSGLSVDALKAMCALNGQIKGGNKADLVVRCTDGKLYGALPRCTLCGIGLLKVVYATKYGHGGQGRFTCPGGYDDDAYVRCSFTADAVERKPWVEE